MSSTQIVNFANYNPTSDISYAKPKLNASGGKNISIFNSKVKKTTMLSTPLMLTWGLSEFVDDKTGKRSYDMSLQFPNSDYPDADGETFLQKLIQFESKIKEDAVNNAREWFNKPKMSAEVIDALWTPMLKYPKNKDTGDFDYTRAPTLRVKIPYWENEWKIELYDVDQNQIWPSTEVAAPMELVPKLSRVAAVIQCGGIWFANGKFGVTWKLFQAVVKPPTSLRGKCHIAVKNDEEDDDGESSGPSNSASATTASMVVQDDSDDEGTAVVAEESAPVSSPAAAAAPQESAAPQEDKKKKVVRRKKDE